MKPIKKISLWFAAILTLCVSCKKATEDQPEVFYISEKDIPTSIDYIGEKFTLSFQCNKQWNISCTEPWVSAAISSGDGEGSTKYFRIPITVKANDSESSRDATLRIEYGSDGHFRDVAIHQGAKSSLKSCTVDSITDDILFSTAPAGTSTSVQQGFDFNEDFSTIYFSQVTAGYKNTISWTNRAVTDSKALAQNTMILLHFSHGNNIHYEKAADGEYLWLASWGTRDSEGKYTNPQTLARVKLAKGTTVRPQDVKDHYYFGTKTIHASFDEKNDQLAIYSQGDDYMMKVYKLSEVLATPVSTVTLKYELTNGGSENGKTSPDPEYKGKPTISAHDCSGLKPIAQFIYKYTTSYAWQTFTLHDGRIYFFLADKKMNPAPNGMYYQSVINVLDLQGNVLKSNIYQPFADNMPDLIRYGFTDDETKYMENEGIIIRDDMLYLLYTAKDKTGFRRPVIFRFSTVGL